MKSNVLFELQIAQVQEKDCETYTVQGIKWLGESENHQTRYFEKIKQREIILCDGPFIANTMVHVYRGQHKKVYLAVN